MLCKPRHSTHLYTSLNHPQHDTTCKWLKLCSTFPRFLLWSSRQTSCRSKWFGPLRGGSATAETMRSHNFGRKQSDLKFRTKLRYEVISCFSVFCCLVLLWGLSVFSGLPDGSSSHTSWPWAAKPVLHHHDKMHRHQTTSPSPGGSPGPGSGMPPVKSSTSPEATSGKPATNIPTKPAE